MNLQSRRSAPRFLVAAVVTQLLRRPYLCASVAAHAALLALLYLGGDYRLEVRQQEAEVASSLRESSEADTVKRLRALRTIKELLEKSADRVATQPEPGSDSLAPPRTPQEMVDRARELSKAIDTLDEEIQAEELAKLTGVPERPPEAAAPPPPVAKTSPLDLEAKANDGPADIGKAVDAGGLGARQARGGPRATVTQQMAAKEVAALEARGRATLVRRRQRLEAKANGVRVEAQKPGSGVQGADGGPTAPPLEGGSSASPALAEISEFIGAGEQFGLTTSSAIYAGLNWDFFDRGTGQPPPVDTRGLVLGRGRKLGAGGEYASRVYLNSWYIIGPFPGRHDGGLFDNPSYPPEKEVLLDAMYYGKNQRLLEWRYVTAQSYPFVPPDSVEDSVYYGYTEVFADEAGDLTAWIGADDDAQIYLNDQLVWKGGNIGKASYFAAVYDTSTSYLRDYNRTEGTRVLHFNKGRNKIFFKLSNGPRVTFLSMVLTR